VRQGVGSSSLLKQSQRERLHHGTFAPSPVELGRWLFAVAGLTAAFAASAANLTFTVYIDRDNNSASGCAVSLPSGATFSGAELRLTTSVTTTANSATVSAVALASCSGASFGADTAVSAGGWPVGIGNGTGGTAVIETLLPLAQLGVSSGTLRMGVVAQNGSGGFDEMAASYTLTGAPAPTSIPTLSQWGLIGLSLLLALAAGPWLRRHPQAGNTLLLVFCVLGVAGVAWAASVSLDGQTTDWAAETTKGSDPLGDGASDVDLAALYAQQDGTNLYLRIDSRVLPLTLSPQPLMTQNIGASVGYTVSFDRPVNSASVAALPTGMTVSATPSGNSVSLQVATNASFSAFGPVNIALTVNSQPFSVLATVNDVARWPVAGLPRWRI